MDGELRPASGIASQADALAKLEAEACPSGQVVMGRISLVPFFFRKRKTLGSKPKPNVMERHDDNKNTLPTYITPISNPKKARINRALVLTLLIIIIIIFQQFLLTF